MAFDTILAQYFPLKGAGFTLSLKTVRGLLPIKPLLVTLNSHQPSVPFPPFGSAALSLEKVFLVHCSKPKLGIIWALTVVTVKKAKALNDKSIFFMICCVI